MKSVCPICGQYDGSHYPRIHKERDKFYAPEFVAAVTSSQNREVGGQA